MKNYIKYILTFLSIGLSISGHTQVVGTPYIVPVGTATVINPPGIKMVSGRYYIASVYDNNYLPYTLPTGPATTTKPTNPDGTLETLADYQGQVTTTGINISLPVTATGTGTLPAFSRTVNVPASLTEDGISRNLTLSWTAQNFTTSTTSILAKIVAEGGTLNAIKLDINNGIGNDYLGVLLANFALPNNSDGTTVSYELRDISGIPDKMFGLADNSGNTNTHLMLYLPVQAEDGKIWLNNNLGADYSNLMKSSFNLAQQATSSTDYKAYGSLIQWGRKTDGHELINYINSTTANAVNGNTTTLSNSPTNALFITNGASPYDWRITQDNTLWATEASPNNPCPSGFRLPTYTETNTLITAAGITSSTTAASSILKLTLTGQRYGSLYDIGNVGYYWHSTTNGVFAYDLYVYNNVNYNSIIRATGAAVRCIKD